MRPLQFLSLLFFVTSVLNAQWTNQNPVPDGNNLWSTFFINDSTGWIIGSDGFIKKTTNAGLDWLQQSSNTNLTLKSVRFFDENRGWICGENGLILKTTNGGQNWFELTSGTTNQLTDIHFCDSSCGYAVGYSGTILKTTNGGTSWFSQSSDPTYDLYSTDFVDALIGYAVGGDFRVFGYNYKILKTTDGGLNWVEKPIPGDYQSWSSLNTVEFVDANTGWIGCGVGGDIGEGSILKTTDGGETWTEQNFSLLKKTKVNDRENYHPDDGNGIRSIFFKDSNIGYAVGGDGGGWSREIFTTTDGGSTWINKYHGSEETGLLSVFVNNSGKGWAVGFDGHIFITEDNSNSWNEILSGIKTDWSGDDIYSVFFINKNIGWAAGKRGGQGQGDVILKTTNSGKIWETQFFGAGGFGPINSIYFINENFGWATSGSNGLFRTTDGGKHWINDCYWSGSATSVSFFNRDTGWVIGGTGIYKSTDGGFTWEQKSSISCACLDFTAYDNGWAVGESGIILKTTNGGESWLNQVSGTTVNLNSVRFYDNNVGMCTGNSGTVLLSTDGGETWISKGNGINKNLKSVIFTNSTSAWIAGDDGTVLQTTDLGNNWASYDSVTENDLTSLYFINENIGWFGGMNGTMLKYENDVLPVELVSFNADVKDSKVHLNWKTSTEVNNNGFDIERKSDSGQPAGVEVPLVGGSSVGEPKETIWKKIGFVEGYGNSSSPRSYSFADDNTTGGSIFNYRLKQINNDGSYKFSPELHVEIMPVKFAVYQNYPNPFNPTTKIRYQIPQKSKVEIKIYDVLGAEVMTLLKEEKEAGTYEVALNAKSLSSGTYIYIMSAGSYVEAKKMVLLH